MALEISNTNISFDEITSRPSGYSILDILLLLIVESFNPVRDRSAKESPCSVPFYVGPSGVR